MINRRKWLKGASLAGAFSLLNAPGFTTQLTAEEKFKYNPRPLEPLVRLSSNENPYGPSNRVRGAMTRAFDISCRYPGGYLRELVDMIAAKEGVTKDHIVVTGGSTEGLKVAGLTYCNDGGELIAGQPTFLAMMNYAKHWGGTINWVPVDENMTYDLGEIERRISDKTKLIFLCNPNNPTSTLLPKDNLRDFCERASRKTMVFSDEAYYDFIADKDYPSMIELVKQDKDVIVSKTFSKVYGLAGLRIGYLVAKPTITTELKKGVMAMTNVIAIKAAIEAMKDQDFYDFSLKQTNIGKAMVYKTLDDLGLSYAPSETNFIFFKSGRDIATLRSQMEVKGVLVGRPFPPFTDWCRISMGTLEEMEIFCKGLKEVM